MRRAATTLVAIVALLAAAGCGEEDDPQAEPPATTETTTTATGEEPTATTAAPEEGSGGGNSGGGREPADERPQGAEQTLEAVLTGSLAPGLICDELVTGRYVRTAYGAREGCIAAQRPGALADSIEVVRLDESRSAAGAVVIPAGGPYDGVEVEVELLREGGGWRVDSLLADVPAGP